jgi:hypothetical protein
VNSLKNTIVAILLLGVSYGVYQILTTAEPKALSTAEFHAANGPEIEIPGETFIPPPIDTDSDNSLSLTEQPKPPQFNAPPVQPPAGVTGPSNQSGQSMPERQLGTNAPSSSPPPWAQIPDNRSSPPSRVQRPRMDRFRCLRLSTRAWAPPHPRHQILDFHKPEPHRLIALQAGARVYSHLHNREM